MKPNRIVPFIAVLLALGTAGRLEAGPILLPGTSDQGLVIPLGPETAQPGNLLASVATPFSITSLTGTITGSLTSAVYRNATGFLDFYYQIMNDTAPGDPDLSISGITAFNFGSSTTAVGYYTDQSLFGGLFASPTLTPEYNRPRAADRTSDGNQVTLWFGPAWNGGNKIEAGDISAILLIATNATDYSNALATLQNHGQTTVESYAPLPVPEPASAVFSMLGGAILMAAYRKRRLIGSSPR